MGKLERKATKAREDIKGRGEAADRIIGDLLAENQNLRNDPMGVWEGAMSTRIRELEAKIEKLTHALASDVRVIKQAGDVIQKLGEDNAKMARILKARGLMTFDGQYTTV